MIIEVKNSSWPLLFGRKVQAFEQDFQQQSIEIGYVRPTLLYR